LPQNVENQISEKASRDRPLTPEQKANNHAKAKIRCRVEHVFASIVQSIGWTFIRCKNLECATFAISMINLLYNIRRVASLESGQTYDSAVCTKAE